MGYSYQKGFGWPHALFALLLLFIIGGIFTPIILRPSGGGVRTEALNNAKAIAGGLSAFKEEYGAYPSPETREADKYPLDSSDVGDRIRKADDANAYLAQLLVTEIIDSETYFYAAGVKGAIKGDDITGTSDKLLARGENSFAYIMTENRRPLTDVTAYTPLVIAPIKAGGKIPIFDGGPYADKFVYGAVDGSGKVGDIDKDTGHAKSKGRTNLFQTGPDSLFGSETPVIKYPLGF